VSEETWQQKHAREEAERSVKAKAAFEKYKADKSKKPQKERWNRGDDPFTDYVYDDGTSETDNAIRVRTSTFRVFDSGRVQMLKSTKTRQKFLCVNGPLAGQRITDDRDNGYMIFNNAYRSYRSSRNEAKTPKAVLVHKSAFEKKS
jgi:hypothetical protein